MKVAPKTPPTTITITIHTNNGPTTGQLALLGHVRGILECEFGKSAVHYELTTEPQQHSQIVYQGRPIATKLLVQNLLDEWNKDAKVRYKLTDIDHLTLEFTSNDEGGKITMSIFAKWQKAKSSEPILTSTFAALGTKVVIAGSDIKK